MTAMRGQRVGFFGAAAESGFAGTVVESAFTDESALAGGFAPVGAFGSAMTSPVTAFVVMPGLGLRLAGVVLGAAAGAAAGAAVGAVAGAAVVVLAGG
jgi:hypothetical protein